MMQNKEIEYYEQLLINAQRMSNRIEEANALSNLGITYNSQGRYDKAVEYYEQALPILREIGNYRGFASAMWAIGDAYKRMEQYDRAINFYEQSLIFFRSIGDSATEAKLMAAMGTVYSNLEQYDKAIEFLEQSLVAIDDRQWEANALNNLGSAYSNLGQYDKAINFCERALNISQKIRNRAAEANALNSLGTAYSRLGNYTQAIGFYNQSLAISRAIRDRDGENQALVNLGSAHSSLGQCTQAIDFYEQSLAISREINANATQANVLQGLGSVYLNLGRYAEGVELYKQSLALFQQLGNRAGEATTLTNLGIACTRLGQYRQAIDFYEQSLAISHRIANLSGEANVLSNLGNVYGVLEQYDKAIEFYKQAITASRKIGDRHTQAYALEGLSTIYGHLGQSDKVFICLEQALVLFQEIGDRSGESGLLITLGTAYIGLKQFAKAIKIYEQSLTLNREIGHRPGEATALANLGIANFERSKFVLATEYLSAAAQVFESLRLDLPDTEKISLVETQLQTYRYWQQAAVAQNEPKQALEISERGRARAFIEQLDLRLGTKITDELVSSNIPTLKQIQQIAQSHNATLVEYSLVSDATLYIWLVKPTGEILFHPVDLSSLEQPLPDLVVHTRDVIGVSRDGSAYRPSDATPQTSDEQARQLQTLYEILIKPIAEVLPPNPDALVVFIPQGDLFSVPFAALLDATTDKSLIETHTILTSPSIQLLDKTQQRRKEMLQEKQPRVVVVGNPTMPAFAGKKLQSLLGAEQEAQKIASLFETQPLLGNKASKRAVMQQMEQAHIIHLATHGILDNDQALDSAIALAPDGTGEANDGLLTAAEIAQMKLNAELVVLSACNTGRGSITGDGVIGLSRALITAGVPSVLVSLWSVPDNSTTELMIEFYERFHDSHNKAQALRQSMLATKIRHKNPIDWAGFSLIGEA